MSIEVQQLTKRFGNFVALENVSFDVPEGQLVALLGPSGGGKSTILRIIAGLEVADTGSVRLDNDPMDGVHARERRIGFVFQHYALFRHMSVLDNIAFGLTVRGVPKVERDKRGNELLEVMGLRGLGGRRPSQLSGGQRQRVALARALAPAPRVLLLDEPFAAVDAKVRGELRRWLRRLHDDMGVTSLFVTHDQDEAFSLADRVVLINKGRVEQVGTPQQVLETPASEFAARFVGDVNVVEAIIDNSRARAGALSIPTSGILNGTRVRLVIRSYDMKFWRDDTNGVATVERVVPLGDRVRVEANMPDVGILFAHFPRRSSLLSGIRPGCKIAVEVTLARAYEASALNVTPAKGVTSIPPST